MREAVKALEGQGLVRSTPFAGVVAAPISLEDFSEVADVRLLLEPIGTALATQHLSPSDLGELSRLIEAMDAALAAGDAAAFAEGDRAFHELLFEHCPNRRLRELLTALRAASQRNTALFGRMPEHLTVSQAEHRVLLAALREGDEAAVEAAARAHRQAVTDRLRPVVAAEAEAGLGAQGGTTNG